MKTKIVPCWPPYSVTDIHFASQGYEHNQSARVQVNFKKNLSFDISSHSTRLELLINDVHIAAKIYRGGAKNV